MIPRLQQLKSLLKEDPKDSFVRYAIAKEYEKANDWGRAITELEALRADDPDYVGLYYHLAHLYAENNELEKAIHIYDEGIGIAKKLDDLHALSELMNAKVNVEL